MMADERMKAKVLRDKIAYNQERHLDLQRPVNAARKLRTMHIKPLLIISSANFE